MPGGKGESRKKVSSEKSWNVNCEKFVIKWWLEQPVIDMNDISSWQALRTNLFAYAEVGMSTSSLQHIWIQEVDRNLDTYFEGMLPHRTEAGFYYKLNTEEKLKIMSARMNQVREEMVKQNMDLPFEVEPKLIQSKVTSIFKPRTSLGESPVAAASASNYGIKSALTTTPTSSLVSKFKRSRSDEPNPLKRHKIEIDPILPMEFSSDKEGAESLDVGGETLPKQIFKGLSFYLLQDVTGIVGKAIYFNQMYLVQLHGGIVYESRRRIREDTLLIGSEYGDNTEVFKNKVIYRPSLITEHVQRKAYMSETSKRQHILRGKMNSVVVKLESLIKDEQDKDEDEVVDLTLDEDDESSEILLQDEKGVVVKVSDEVGGNQHSCTDDKKQQETSFAEEKDKEKNQIGNYMTKENPPIAREANLSNTEESPPTDIKETSAPMIKDANSPITEQASPPTTEDTRKPHMKDASSPTTEHASPPRMKDAGTPTMIEAASKPITEKESPPTMKESGPPSLKEASPPLMKESSPPSLKAASACTMKVISDPNAEVPTISLSDDVINEFVRDGCCTNVVWTEADKRFSLALLFRNALGQNPSRMEIYRKATIEFEKVKGTPLSQETLRTRFKRLLKKKTSYKQLFDSLKDEFGLTNEMLIGFERMFKKKSDSD